MQNKVRNHTGKRKRATEVEKNGKRKGKKRWKERNIGKEKVRTGKRLWQEEGKGKTKNREKVNGKLMKEEREQQTEKALERSRS